MSGGQLVLRRVDAGVGIITLSDPEHRNALSKEMSDQLAAAVDAVLDDGARAIVVTAAPPVFCAGGSLESLVSPTAPLREMYAGFRRLAGAPVPTIAAVGTPVIGAGVNIPLACDVVIVSGAARFDPRFLDVGIHPGGGHLWRLSRRVGAQGAAALVLCGDVLTGGEAAAAGLAWRCVEDDELEATALRLARRAAGRDGELVRRAKASLRASLAVAGEEEAVELELEAQSWSMARPGFAEGIRRLQQRLGHKS